LVTLISMLDCCVFSEKGRKNASFRLGVGLVLHWRVGLRMPDGGRSPLNDSQLALTQTLFSSTPEVAASGARGRGRLSENMETRLVSVLD
jgi:hypothetical protein